MTHTDDHYKTLGVGEGASQEEIKGAYRKLARELHPDAQGGHGDEERFKEVGQAYEVLSDPQKRAEYDTMRRVARQGFQGGGFGGAGFGGGWQRGGFGGGTYSAGPQEVDLNSLFGGGGEVDLNELFGGGRRAGGRRPRPARGQDVEAEASVTLEEVLHGATRQVNAPGGAQGRTVRLPVGVADGDGVRVPGAGLPGVSGGPPGDLRVRVSVAPHAVFERDGRDLTRDVTITPWEAALGARVMVGTLDGTVSLSVPAGVQGGQRLRLRGKGLPDRAGDRGDLYARIRIAIPKDLSPKARELFEELSREAPLHPQR